MKVTFNSANCSYGTGRHTKQLEVSVYRWDDEISLDFNFIKSARGRGAGDKMGRILSCELCFAESEARKIAAAILATLDIDSAAKKFAFD